MSSEVSLAEGLIAGDDGLVRCWWPGQDEAYCRYHDAEWGRPVMDDRRLFEKICLEGFQSGLSWLTILRKREGFRAAFDGFDFDKIATYDEADIERLLGDAAIVRHRGKIVSTINNARRACVLRDEFGALFPYFRRFVPLDADRPDPFTKASIRQASQTGMATALSKDLKKRGWTFVGPTTAYAFMQAMGLVNDHLEGCHCRQPVEVLRVEALSR